jgi:hypothetical protein
VLLTCAGPCSAGSFEAVYGVEPGCVACDPGTYQNVSGSRGCTTCPAGLFTGVFGATSAGQCTRGGGCCDWVEGQLDSVFDLVSYCF